MRTVSQRQGARPGRQGTARVWRARWRGRQPQARRGGGDPGERRNPDEQGAMLVLATFAIIMLLMVAGVAIDLGTAYAGGRQMQDAADAAALAATNELECVLFAPGSTTPPAGVGCQTLPATAADVGSVALTVAKDDGASPTQVTCEIIGPYTGGAAPGYATVAPCSPTSGWAPGGVPAPGVAGVYVSTGNGQATFFGGITGTTHTNEVRQAAATIQPLTGAGSPILFCADSTVTSGLGNSNANSTLPPLLLAATAQTTSDQFIPAGPGYSSVTDVFPKAGTDASGELGYEVNPSAIGQQNYLLHAPNGGNSGKGIDRCGVGSSQFKGDAGSGTFTLPGPVSFRNGEVAGPFNTNLANQPGCSGLYSGHVAGNCDILVPICVGTTSNEELYCVTFGNFDVTHVTKTKVNGTFLGLGNATQGSTGTGNPTFGVVNVVRLVQ